MNAIISTIIRQLISQEIIIRKVYFIVIIGAFHETNESMNVCFYIKVIHDFEVWMNHKVGSHHYDDITFIAIAKLI